MTDETEAKPTRKYRSPAEQIADAKKEREERKRKEILRKKVQRKRENRRTASSRAKKVMKSRSDRIVDQTTVNMAKDSHHNVEDHIIFRPNAGPQTEFLAAGETDVLYGGQAGGGKSYALIVDALRYVHRAKYRALILRRTLKELSELIDNTRALYPKAYQGAKYKEQEKVWTFPSGAKILFGYLERDADVYQYQGQAFAYIAFDELTHLPTEFPWNYLASRLRSTDPEIECYMRATTNPGGQGSQWVKQRYIDPAPPNERFQYGENPITGKKLYRRFIPAALKDNPYLYEDGNYQAMLETLPEVERRRLLEGDWDIAEGIAFPEFRKEIHVIPQFEIPPAWERIKGADQGYTDPSCCLWGAIDPDDGTLIIYRELYEKGLTAEELGETIMAMEMRDPTTVSGYIDYAVWNRTGYSGNTIGVILNQLGCKFRPANKDRVAGKIQIHERLKPNPKTGRPQMQFMSTCTNIIRELGTIPLSTKNSEDVDTTASDHAYDALRYMVMGLPKMRSVREDLAEFKQRFIITDSVFGY